MSNFLCSTVPATQKKCISTEQDLCRLTVLFAMPMAVELLQCTGVGGWGWPISSSVSQNIVACLQFRKRAPSLASAVEATMKRNIAHRVKKAPFNLMGLVGSARQLMKNMSTGSAVGVCFGKTQHVQMDVKDQVGCMKTDHRIRVCCQVVEQLLHFGRRLLRSLCLFACDCTECHEHC